MRPGLYAIVDLDALGARDPLEFVDAVLTARATSALQLRAKHAFARDVLPLARVIAHRCKAHAVPFFLNDRPDWASLIGADGVHVGQDDLSVDEVRRIDPKLRVGTSTHGVEQFRVALAMQPDYVAFGPVFATSSKLRPDPIVGLDALREVVSLAGSVPVVAIGGITLEHAHEVRAAGACCGAVIGALASVEDPHRAGRARALHTALGGD
jgi:thiamine-phosphate pyrophosphorylase